MQKVTPFLWFDGTAEEAMNFYVSVFKNARIIELRRRGDDGPVMSGTFEIDGQRFHAFNGGPVFKFSEAISLFVNCETQAEVDDYWARLLDGGTPQQCGWITDRFGVTWQIVPTALGRMLQDKDAARSRRVMEAMLKMVKLDLGELERAYNGK